MAGWEKAESKGGQEGFHIFDKDPMLVGKLIKIENEVGLKKNSTIYTLTKKDKTDIKFWGSTVLDDLMSEYVVGDVIKVVFMGMGKSQGGAQYKIFETFKWNPNATQVEEAPTPPLLSHEQAMANDNGEVDDFPEESDTDEISLDDIPF